MRGRGVTDAPVRFHDLVDVDQQLVVTVIHVAVRIVAGCVDASHARARRPDAARVDQTRHHRPHRGPRRRSVSSHVPSNLSLLVATL
eukprot:2264166-Rhodomonas_salina.2